MKPLEAVTRIWHPKIFDVLRLKETGRFGACVRIVESDGREVIAKTARLDFDIRLVENEPVYMRSSRKTQSDIRILQRYILLSLAISPRTEESWACLLRSWKAEWRA